MESLTPNISRQSNILLSYQVFLKQLQALTSSKKILIAYSGGLDSHVLLHLASQLSQSDKFQVRAVHIHHGLQDISATWVPHCQQVCEKLHIPIEIQKLNLKVEVGVSTEDLARTARYSAFRKTIQKTEVLLTAHHQNDQAETLLLQLFRGAGVQGLAAMPAVTRFDDGLHARPLLNFSRKDLEVYAKDNDLDYIEDPSNKDCAFDRNYLRTKIMPELRSRWPSIDKTISRSASIQSETKQLLDEVAEQDLALIQNKSDVFDKKLSLLKLQTFSMARQKLVIRFWIVTNGFKAPSEKKLKHIFTDVINAGNDTQPIIKWDGVELRRYQNSLYIMSPLKIHDKKQVIKWDNPQLALTHPLLLNSLSALSSYEYNEKLPVTIRFRQGGEKFYHSKRGITISLKNYLHESDVPPWLRSRIPLIYSGETLIKVAGLE